MSVRSKVVGGAAVLFAGMGLALAPVASAATSIAVTPLPAIRLPPIHICPRPGPIIALPQPAMIMCPL